MGFPQLRLAHFQRALLAAGHSVRTVLLEDPASPGSPRLPRPGEAWEGTWRIPEEGPGWLEQLFELKRGAEVLVSAGPYNPGLAAVLVAEREPVWADIPGDPFAELQAVAMALARTGNPEELEGPSLQERVAAAQAAAWAVLVRADAFSVVSAPQRYALLGQLGLAGRLADVGGRADLTGRDRVHVLPVAYAFGMPQSEPRPRAPGEPLGVALVGGFNTWFDEETLIDGLERVMERTECVRVHALGGGIPRHHEQGYARFAAWARRPERKGRVVLHEWVPQHVLPEVLSQAHVGVNLDRPGYEPELGSRTRLLLFAHQGLEAVSTARCDLARELAGEDLLLAVPQRDPDALAEVLTETVRRGSDGRRAAQAQRFLADRYAPLRIAEPLAAWVSRPDRLAPARAPAAALAEENARLRSELVEIYASPTWRALSRLHGRVRRRPGSRRTGGH